jgi:hypothetical protein
MSSSDIIKSYLPTYYFKADNSTVNSDGSVNPTVTTGGSNTFFTNGGAWDTGYINSGSSSGTGYGFQHSDTTAIFDDKSFTISGWFNVASTSSTINWIFHTGTAATGIGLQNGLIFTTIAGGNATTSASITLNKWNHFAWVVNGSTQELFLNGVSTGTAVATPSTISMDSSTKYWFRETTSGTPRRGVAGKFDELAVFDSALSSADIYILAKSIPPMPMTASSTMQNPAVYTNNLVAQAISDKAVYVFKLDTSVTDVAGVAMTGGRSFSCPKNTATYQSGQSTTGGTGSWFITNSNTAGNEITLTESSSPVITYEKGLTVEMVFYYPAYVAPDAAGQYIYQKAWSGGGVDIKFQTTSGVNYVEAGFSGGGYHTHTQGLVPGRWYHVVARWDATDDYTYLTINGSTETSANKNTGSGNNFSSNSSFNIGGDCGLYFDYIALYSEQYNSTKLANSQLTDHYNSFNAARSILQSGNVLATPMTATAMIPTTGVAPGVALTAFATFINPSFNTIKNKNVSATVLTASVQSENPVVSAGTTHGALHMDADADMGQDSHPFIVGVGFANPMIATALITVPTVSVQKGALIKPQSLNSNAFLPTPPAYYLVTDDRWYQRLLDVDYQSSDFKGSITFFNTSNNLYLDGEYGDWWASPIRSPLQPYYGYNLYDSPLPTATAGYFDPINRKALNIKNIAFINGDNQTYSQGWTMETMIQTTKKNQFIAAGRYLGDPSSSTSRSKQTGIRLKDGKIAFTKVKDKTQGFVTSTDAIAFSGFKDIADGQWHHLIIQYRDDDDRIQVWIDGELDIQRYGNTVYFPGQLGFNSNDIDSYSDFKISAIALNKESFVLERETKLNYFASIGHVPFEATTATADVKFGTETIGRGNRARALMLYFWPTWNAKSGYYVGSDTNPFSPSGVNTSQGHDVGNKPFDYDTFYGLSTYLTNETQTFFDWDVFPLPVKKFYAGDTYRGDKHPLLNESVFIDTLPEHGKVYVNPVTDNYRYVNLMEDVYKLDQYDAIFFRNYPDQSTEQDEMGLNSKTEVDEYFNLQEKTLFAEFLNNLREAVDTYNISLFVTNPQLAKDLGIIANATEVPLLRNQGSFYADEWSDNRAPIVTGRALVDGTPTDPVNAEGAGWYDTWFNDRHRVINQLEYLTDDNAFIWTDYAFYKNSDVFEYGGPDRLYKRYENRPYGLQIDDEFVFADSGNPRFRLPYQAVKPEDVLAGIPITALSKKIWNQNYAGYVQVDNPYKDYVTTIALPVGTNLKGKLTGGKIFVSFSENVGNYFTSENPQYNTSFVEYHEYDMASNYWVDIAYNAKIITDAQRAQYKAGTAQQPPLYDDNDIIKQYWSLSGDNLISRIEPITQNLKGFVGGDIPLLLQNPTKTRTRQGLTNSFAGERLRDALGRFASGGGSNSVTGGNLSTFKITTGRTYDTGTIFIPSINTRALWWLSDKVRLTGKVVGGPAAKATALIPEPVVTADHPNTVLAGAMIASANINDSQFMPADKRIAPLPMYASATINNLRGKNISAGIGANASAGIVQPFAVTQGAEQIIVYLHHVNPTLYLRKEIIR